MTMSYKGATIMNKQQLANKIWESANKMRSKIEANEYKDSFNQRYAEKGVQQNL